MGRIDWAGSSGFFQIFRWSGTIQRPDFTPTHCYGSYEIPPKANSLNWKCKIHRIQLTKPGPHTDSKVFHLDSAVATYVGKRLLLKRSHRVTGISILGGSMKVCAMRVKSVLKFFSFFSDGTGYPNLKIGLDYYPFHWKQCLSLRNGFPTRCVIMFCEGFLKHTCTGAL